MAKRAKKVRLTNKAQRDVAAQVAYELLGDDDTEPNEVLQRLFDEVKEMTLAKGRELALLVAQDGERITRALAQLSVDLPKRMANEVAAMINVRVHNESSVGRASSAELDGMRADLQTVTYARDRAREEHEKLLVRSVESAKKSADLQRNLSAVGLRLGILKSASVVVYKSSGDPVKERDNNLLLHPDLLWRAIDEELVRLMKLANLTVPEMPKEAPDGVRGDEPTPRD